MSALPAKASDQLPPPFLRVGFSEVGAGLVGAAAMAFLLEQVGAGMAVSQSGGNLLITTGTTANGETVIRSAQTFSGSLMARLRLTLSQRIANQSFRFELADLVGEDLAYTINSATSVTVTFPQANPFTADNVGQFLRLSQVTGAAGVPGRYAIASVSGLSVTFTVAGWPATGSGTLCLYGWNWIGVDYTGTAATNVNFDAQRRGWASGASVLSVNSTAAPGHVLQLTHDVHTAGIADALVASTTQFQWAARGCRVENLPDPDVPMYLFIVVQNGSTAPASTTTLTLGFVQIEDQGRQKVRLASADPSVAHLLPVQVMGGSVTATANIGSSGLLSYTDSSTNLAGGATFTGTSRDAGATPAYNLFVAQATADVAGTLRIERSTDGTTWRKTAEVAVAAGDGKELTVRCTARYHRVLYVNGATAQAAFLLTSAYQRI